MSIVAVAFVRPKSENVDDVREALRKAAEQVHDEPGCELYTLQEGRDEFIVIEKWKDFDALKTHGKAAPFQELSTAIEDLVREPMDVHVGNPLEVGSSPLGKLG